MLWLSILELTDCPHSCHSSAICRDTLTSFTCSCAIGYRPTVVNATGANLQCKGMNY